MKDPREWNFDVDQYVNQIVPPPPWCHLPTPVSWFFGHRPPSSKPTPKGNLMSIVWAFIGIFCGIVLIEAVSTRVPSFKSHSAPLIVGSFGAAAVLEFYAIESPLAQPRNAILGQAISSVVGVCICRLFLLHDDFESVRWLGGALACAAATALMALTKTVHPPAGATALLAVTDDGIVALGWYLPLVVLLGCALMLVVALIVNNIGRRFPTYWWTPEPLPLEQRRRSRKDTGDMEKGRGMLERTDGSTSAQSQKGSTHELEQTGEQRSSSKEQAREVVIRPGHVSVPESLSLSNFEILFLESLSERL